MRSLPLVGVSILALMVAVAGCGQKDGSAPASERAVRAQSALDAARDLYRQEEAAERKLVRRCMVRKGFKIFPPEPTPEVGDDGSDRRVGLMSPTLAEAERSGYGFDPRLHPDREGSESESDWGQLSDDVKLAHTLAMSGPDSDVVRYDFPDGSASVPRTGCVGEVRAALFGDLKEYLKLSEIAVNHIGRGTNSNMRGDPNLAAAEKRWSECMSTTEHGGFNRVADVRRSAHEAYSGLDADDDRALDQARKRETALAAADSKCAQQVSLNEAAAAARAGAAEKSLLQYEAEITAWQQMVGRALTRAQQMLAEE